MIVSSPASIGLSFFSPDCRLKTARARKGNRWTKKYPTRNTHRAGFLELAQSVPPCACPGFGLSDRCTQPVGPSDQPRLSCVCSGRGGFEPPLTAPKAAVLPLHHQPNPGHKKPMPIEYHRHKKRPDCLFESIPKSRFLRQRGEIYIGSDAACQAFSNRFTEFKVKRCPIFDCGSLESKGLEISGKAVDRLFQEV